MVLSCGCRSVLELLCGEDSSSELPAAGSSPYLAVAAPPEHSGELRGGDVALTGSEPEALAESEEHTASSQGEVSSGTSLNEQVSAGKTVANSNHCHADPSSGQSAGEGMKVLFESGLLKPILLLLKSKLSRDSWKRHPMAKHALVWCLRHLKVTLLAVYTVVDSTVLLLQSDAC